MKLDRLVRSAALVSVVAALIPLTAAAAAAVRPTTEPAARRTPVESAAALVARVLPGHADAFTFAVIPAEDGKDVFEYEQAPNGRIALRGNNGVALAVAFNQYLRREAHLDYDWLAVAPLKLDRALPQPAAKVRAHCAAAERFFLNYCTYGYTMPWWDWARWQRFIDWMAMNGVNRPLLQCGQEAVWLRVWQDYGMSADEIRAYFSSPAHLPWHRMANLDRWGGPLPMSYIEGQQKLQWQILTRAREFGMRPILSGFAGHVPPQIARSHPQAKITHIGAGWGGMPHEYATNYLDPTDPLFAEIQKKFITQQTALYGTDHLYAADPFNEMAPPSLELDYLANVSRGIFDGMAAADPDAHWYQMAWTYARRKEWSGPGRMAALLRAVPQGRLIMLDYVCEETEFYPRSENFQGQPFIWNYLGNFGGNTHLVAPLHKVAARIENALRVPNCIGVGSTLEGINVNPVIYQMVLEQPWLPGAALDVGSWVNAYAGQRAGGDDPAVAEAWHALAQNVLVDKARGIGVHASVFQERPPLKGPGPDFRINRQTQIDYPPRQLVAALERMLQAGPAARASDGYAFDVVNLTRQALANQGNVLYARVLAAYAKKDVAQFQRAAKAFLEAGRDLDALLGTRHEFLLGAWLQQARAWGRDAAEADYYETNARDIITAWHVTGGGLDDYANRQYNGLLRDYYLPRWEKFFALCTQSLEKGTPFPQQEFVTWANAFSERWVHSHGETYLSAPAGNAVETAERLFHKYFATRAGASPAQS